MRMKFRILSVSAANFAAHLGFAREPAAHSLKPPVDTRWLYIVELEGLALLFFAILYAPFALRGRRKNAAFLIVVARAQ